jgi:hypothetical protein
MLLTGAGEGCDYCIDCNKKFIIFDAESDEKAIAHATEYMSDNFSSDEIDKVQLLRVGSDLSDCIKIKKQT